MTKHADEAESRRLDWALDEIEGGQRPPDLTDQILARIRSGERPIPRTQGPRHTLRFLLAAAGLAIVATVGWLSQTQEEAGEPSLVGPLPPPVQIHSPDEVQALPPNTKNVRAVGIDDEGLRSLTEVHDIERLELRNDASKATPSDDGMAHLAALPKLRQLTLDWQRKLTGQGLTHLRRIPILESLTLRGATVDQDGAAVLAELHKLRNLELRIQPELGDRPLAKLAGMDWLRKLVLEGCGNLTSQGLAQLGSLQRLRHLELARLTSPSSGESSPVNDAVVRALQNLRELHTLKIPGAAITDRGLVHLAQMTALHTLDLTGCAAVTDRGVEALLSGREVRTLHLSGTSVTEALYDTLIAERSLEELHVPFDWVTPGMRKRLRNLPNMKRLITERPPR